MPLTKQQVTEFKFLITQTARVLGEYYTFDHGGDRDGKLSTGRDQNIKAHIDQLISLRDQITVESEKTFDELLEDTVDILNDADLKNCDLSRHYNKDHQSYNQNRLLGQNPVTAWFNKTLFQSRAQVQIEKAKDLVKKFQAQFETTKSLTPTVP